MIVLQFPQLTLPASTVTRGGGARGDPHISPMHHEPTTPPGTGNGCYHPAQERAYDSAQEADAYMSLVPTKPEILENEVQSGVSDSFYPAKDRALKLRPW